MYVQFEDYHELADVSDIDLTPDCEELAMVQTTPKTDQEYESTVYVSALDGTKRQFTMAAGEDANPRWSPSGDRLAFVSTRGETDSRSLWVIPKGGGEGRKVTNVVGGVSDIVWRPDGEAIAFVQDSSPADREGDHDLSCDEEYTREDPDPRVIDRHVYRAHGEYLENKRSHIYLTSLDSGSVTRITAGDTDHGGPDWDADGTLYYTARRTGIPDDNLVHDIIAHDVANDDQSLVTQTTGWDPGLSVSEEGRLAYRRSALDPPGPSMRTTDIEVYDPVTEETNILTENFDRRIYRGTRPHWGPDCERLYFLVPDEGAVDVYTVPADGTGEPAPVIDGPGHISELTVGDDSIAFVRSDWDHPGDVFIADLEGTDCERMTEANAEYLQERSLVEPEELWFDSPDGTSVQGWLLTPTDFDPDSTYPLVVEVHGGPTIMWSRSGSMWHEFQSLAARGYVVFWCNPRGSSGYGEDHATAISDDWGSNDSSDILAGIETVLDRPYVDSENVFVTGGSFGGFLTAWLLAHSDVFTAGVAQRGVYDQVTQFGTTDTYHSSEKQLGLPWEEHSTYWDASPVAYADQVTVPTLLLHSENDFRVPVVNAEILYRFLKKNDVTTRLVRYPREGHGLSRNGEPAHVVDRLERIGAWFDGYSDHHESDPVVSDSDGSERTRDDN